MPLPQKEIKLADLLNENENNSTNVFENISTHHIHVAAMKNQKELNINISIDFFLKLLLSEIYHWHNNTKEKQTLKISMSIAPSHLKELPVREFLNIIQNSGTPFSNTFIKALRDLGLGFGIEGNENSTETKKANDVYFSDEFSKISLKNCTCIFSKETAQQKATFRSHVSDLNTAR